jgi:hypothetical protein
MPSLSTPPKAWVLGGPASALARLEPLIEAHRRRRPVRVLTTLEAIGGALDHADAVLLVGGVRKSPGRALSGVFLTAPNGARVPAGWLPDAGARLATYAKAATKALERAGLGPAVVLGEYEQRALALADRVTAESGAAPTFNWTAQRLTRAGLSDALGCGPGIALYVGHALAGGWAGYGGFGHRDLGRVPAGNPVGALLSISCSAASRPRRGLSFCEEAALGGVCIAALGACGPTLHASNAELALALACTLKNPGVTTLAALLLAAPVRAGALDRYRIVGDPLAPLAGAPGCDAAARRIFAPGPDDALPVIPLDAWSAPPECAACAVAPVDPMRHPCEVSPQSRWTNRRPLIRVES